MGSIADEKIFLIFEIHFRNIFFRRSLKRDPSERLAREGPLQGHPLLDPQIDPKWCSNYHTFRSLSRRLLGVERGACTFVQPFYAILGRGIIYECIPIDLDEISFASFFLKKKGSDALKDPKVVLENR